MKTEAQLEKEVESIKVTASKREAEASPMSSVKFIVGVAMNSLKELQTKSTTIEEERRKLAEANIKLKEDVSTCKSKQLDLEAKYSTAVAEKHKSVEQLQDAERTIEDLTQQHSSQGQKLQSQISSLMDENRLLNEVLQNTKKELHQVISNLEEKLKEQKAGEAALKSEVKNLKAEAAEKSLLQNSLKELQTKLAHCEEESRRLAEANKKRKEDVSTCKSKQRDLEAKYSTAVAEKHKSVEQLQDAEMTIEDLTQQHSSQGQKLQSQISSLIDENRLLNEVHQNTKKELQLVISNLEEQLKEQKAGEATLKSEVKNLKVEAAEKPLLQNSLKELQNKLAHCEEERRKLAEANIKLKEDVSTSKSKQRDLEAKYSTAVAEKHKSVEQLQDAKKTIEDLTQQHYSQGQKLQSQISSLMDENRQLNEVHQNTKKELQLAEAAEKPLLQNSLKELQNKLAHCEEESRKLVEANIKLKEDVSTYESKQSDLEAKYSTAIAENDESVEKLQAAKKTIEDLMQQHSSQGQKLQSQVCTKLFCNYVAAKYYCFMVISYISSPQISSLTDENNLLDKVHQNTKKELQLAISNLEEQLKEQKAGEATLKSEVENLKAEAAEKPLLQNSLKELQTKSAHFEEKSRKLVEANIKLKEDVSTYESKQSDLEAKYSTAVAENDESVEQLQAAKRTIEDLMQQHSSQGQKLQSQISSLTDENNLLNEVHQNTKKELQLAISNLEEQLKEQKTGEAALKSEVENLKAEVVEKPLLQNSLKELQTKSAHFEEESRKLAEANIKLKEDVSTYESKQSDLEAKYSTAVAENDESVEQLQATKTTIEDLMQQHSSQWQKLQSQAESIKAAAAKREAEASPMPSVKFIVGVAVVFAIIGLILGKRY
ncbi:uncharacterized protein [Pyrus communis]|uniref:uncharacterized protein n=1 Tax=Pyrus communis TaxID=23211 RepID=UPI0035C11E63